jgi:hypothetical protein
MPPLYLCRFLVAMFIMFASGGGGGVKGGKGPELVFGVAKGGGPCLFTI